MHTGSGLAPSAAMNSSASAPRSIPPIPITGRSTDSATERTCSTAIALTAGPESPPLRLALVNDYEIVLVGLAHLFDRYQDRVTIVEIDPDAELPVHSHENEQLGMVVRGSMRFRIGDEERDLGPGGMWRIPPNTPHSARAGPDGAVALDVFTPTRDDWKSLETEEPRRPTWL